MSKRKHKRLPMSKAELQELIKLAHRASQRYLARHTRGKEKREAIRDSRDA